MTKPCERLAALDASRPFSSAMAREAGLGYQDLHRLTAAGRLRRLVAGAYVLSSTPDSLELRCAALALVVPPGCFVCDRTAAWLHVGARALAPNEHHAVPRVSCFRPPDAGRLRNGLVSSGEREIVPADLMEIGGILVTTPLRTALDLGRLESTPDLRLHGMDSMLAVGAFGPDELLAAVPRFKRRRGVVLLRVLAPLADGGSESFGESALRLRAHHAGLPRLQTQVPVTHEGVELRIDLGLPEVLFGAEYDGVEAHSTEEQIAHDDWRRKVLRDRHRWMVEVFRRDHVFGHGQTALERLQVGYRRAVSSLGVRTFVI